MVHENIPITQRREDALGCFPLAERRWRRWHEGRILQRRPVNLVDLPQRREVQQPGHVDDITGIDIEFTQQQLQHALCHVVGNFQTNGGAEPPARQFPLERLQQVFVAVLFHFEIRVTGNAERVVLDDFHAWEKHRQERGDQLLHRQEPHHVRRAFAGAQLDEAIDIVGHLDSGEVLSTVVGMLDGDREVQAKPAHERERVCRVDRQRGQDREHLLVEVRRQPRALVLVELGPRHDHDAFIGQRRAHRVEEHMRMPAGDLLSALADPAQLLARRQSVGRPHRQAHLVATLQTRDAHHIELVEVRREDRQEFRPLQQRQGRVGGKSEHPRIEFEPAQLAVEVTILRQSVVDRG